MALSKQQDKNRGMIQYSTREASPEQVSGPGGVYISPRGIVYNILGAGGAKVRWCIQVPVGKCTHHLGRKPAPGRPPGYCIVSFGIKERT